MAFVTRFAPSPTGPLHLGHAFSAMLAHDMAQDGTFLLRLEDIDRQRSREMWVERICDDLRWLGLDWPDPVMRQSERGAVYAEALDRLWARGLLYPCRCTRRDVEAAMSAPQEGGAGPDGPVYPGTCRGGDRRGVRPRDTALRLDMARTLEGVPDLRFMEAGTGPVVTSRNHYLDRIGDVVLSRRDMGTSYHLSVVLDDAAQGITDVVRGADLFDATRIHVLLQRLLDLPSPVYHHHRLIRDAGGKRLAKRDDARALATYREAGAGPEDIRRMVGLQGTETSVPSRSAV